MTRSTRTAPWRIAWAVACAALLVDQITKALVLLAFPVGASAQALPGVWITHARNTGALWGSAQGMNVVFILISFVALFFLVRSRAHFRTPLGMLALGLLLGGIAGNLVDRILFGSVTDFLALRWWPIFNVADSAIVSGVALAIFDGIRTRPAR